jgi:cyanophycin synthetase
MRIPHWPRGSPTAQKRPRPGDGLFCWIRRRPQLEIVSLGIALFEIRIDLDGSAGLLTKDVPDFGRNLLMALPTLDQHKCWSGESGGFVEELQLGTDFAHVVEHVILELQHLADPRHRIYSGWTKCSPEEKALENRRFYTIHFQTRSFEVGSSAAQWAVRIVSDLIAGDNPPTEEALAELRRLSW